jgi:hypothetical protein
MTRMPRRRSRAPSTVAVARSCHAATAADFAGAQTPGGMMPSPTQPKCGASSCDHNTSRIARGCRSNFSGLAEPPFLRTSEEAPSAVLTGAWADRRRRKWIKCLLDFGAGVGVDLQADSYLNDLRGLPSHIYLLVGPTAQLSIHVSGASVRFKYESANLARVARRPPALGSPLLATRCHLTALRMARNIPLKDKGLTISGRSGHREIEHRGGCDQQPVSKLDPKSDSAV